MTDYEAKNYYQNTTVAHDYDHQYTSALSLSNLRSRLVGWGEVQAFSRMLKRAPKGGRVLDIACGTGRWTEQLLNAGYQAGGVDMSPQMIAYARRRLEHRPNLLFFQNADAEHLGFNDKHFDGVVCMRLYHRIPPANRRRMLEEVKRVGSNWGIFSFGMTTPWLRFRGALRSKLIGGRPSNPYPITPQQLHQELEAVGFKVQSSAWVLPILSGELVVFVRW